MALGSEASDSDFGDLSIRGPTWGWMLMGKLGGETSSSDQRQDAHTRAHLHTAQATLDGSGVGVAGAGDKREMGRERE